MKTAVILFNLGGPDSLSSVKPFLFNLFRDYAIIRAPFFVRYPLAWLISSRREKTAQEIYRQIGGKSPIVELTQAQAGALENALREDGGQWKVFFSMRYWDPFSREVAQEVKDFAPEKIILLPLYPQYSTTTTESSLKDWQTAARKAGLGNVPASGVCCYPQEPRFIDAHVTLIKNALADLNAPPRLLFSAHGLPEKIVAAGDPYQWQVEQTVAAVVQKLGIEGLDYVTCYQSRVGPLKWIGPSTDDEIIRAGNEQKPVMVVPIAFVSEHSETLVELDIEYRHLAEKSGVPVYTRVPALGCAPDFIASLKTLCMQAKDRHSVCGPEAKRLCPKSFSACGHGFLSQEAA